MYFICYIDTNTYISQIFISRFQQFCHKSLFNPVISQLILILQGKWTQLQISYIFFFCGKLPTLIFCLVTLIKWEALLPGLSNIDGFFFPCMFSIFYFQNHSKFSSLFLGKFSHYLDSHQKNLIQAQFLISCRIFCEFHIWDLRRSVPWIRNKIPSIVLPVAILYSYELLYIHTNFCTD